MESVITGKVEQLCHVIESHATKKTVVNLSDVFFAFTNDVVTNMLFAHKANVLGDENNAAVLRKNTYDLLLGIHVNKHFPWIPDFLESLPLYISKPIMPPGLIDLLALFERVRKELIGVMQGNSLGENVPNSKDRESICSIILDNPILPQEERSLRRLEEECALLVLAGTESPAKTLSCIFCYLLSNPPILGKLRAELSMVSENASWTELEKLPYLTAVIEEGNRLAFGVTARIARIAHEPLEYTPSPHITSPSGKSYTIPSGTPMSITTLSAHTNEDIFPDPFMFDPERWLGAEGRERKKYNMAFGKGGRKCLGIEIARAELYLVTAALVRRFDMKLSETDVAAVAFEYDYQVSMPKVESKGVRVIVEKKQVIEAE